MMKVTLIDYMGSDLSVVNAARVSFAKRSDFAWSDEGQEISDRDAKLIRFLARANHWTPFGHTAVTLHIKAPIFIARQLGKHQVGLVWNEVSRRYVDDDPEFFVPNHFRERAANVKQGSGDGEVTFLRLQGFTAQTPHDAVSKLHLHSVDLYRDMLESGICPEQARMVLPQSMMTEWYWTGSIAAFNRVYKLRIDPHSQKEVQDVAAQIGTVIKPLFPISWEALTS